MTVKPQSLANLTGGSRKGRPNRVPVDLRAGVLQSFQNRGGVKWLDTLPDDIFAGIFKQCLPKDIKLDATGPITLRVITGTPEELGEPGSARLGALS